MGLIVDNFAGGGGASTGIEAALGRPVDYAINHDPAAIAIHKANHPNTHHYCQNIWQINPYDVAAGRPIDLAWFSPDCKHFSKAKGGKPVEKRIRDLAWVVVEWAKTVRPKVIMLENVEEFQDWGPLLEDGSPCPVNKGFEFRRWVKALRSNGYKVEWRELRACDYFTPTIRKRLFLIARRDGLPIVWPAPTHGKGLAPYLTVAGCIDWSIAAPSIFERKKPLADKTMARIARGLRRFVIDEPNPFIISYYGEKREGDFRGFGLDEPLKTQTTENRFGIVTPFVSRQFSRSTGSAADEPIGAATEKGKSALVVPHLSRQFGMGTGRAVDGPAPTIMPDGGGKTAMVAAFLAQHNSGMTGHRAEKPLSTITSRGTQQNIVATHLMKYRGSSRQGQPIDKPAPTITGGGMHLAEVRAFLLKYYGTATGQDIKDPLHSATSKARFGLVTVAGEDYQIVDIGMRMLTPRELFRAQGFPDSYIIDPEFNGKPMTKTAQIKACGNSVCPPLVAALVQANVVETRRISGQQLGDLAT